MTQITGFRSSKKTLTERALVTLWRTARINRSMANIRTEVTQSLLAMDIVKIDGLRVDERWIPKGNIMTVSLFRSMDRWEEALIEGHTVCLRELSIYLRLVTEVVGNERKTYCVTLTPEEGGLYRLGVLQYPWNQANSLSCFAKIIEAQYWAHYTQWKADRLDVRYVPCFNDEYRQLVWRALVPLQRFFATGSIEDRWEAARAFHCFQVSEQAFFMTLPFKAALAFPLQKGKRYPVCVYEDYPYACSGLRLNDSTPAVTSTALLQHVVASWLHGFYWVYGGDHWALWHRRQGQNSSRYLGSQSGGGTRLKLLAPHTDTFDAAWRYLWLESNVVIELLHIGYFCRGYFLGTAKPKASLYPICLEPFINPTEWANCEGVCA